MAIGNRNFPKERNPSAHIYEVPTKLKALWLCPLPLFSDTVNSTRWNSFTISREPAEEEHPLGVSLVPGPMRCPEADSPFSAGCLLSALAVACREGKSFFLVTVMNVEMKGALAPSCADGETEAQYMDVP